MKRDSFVFRGEWKDAISGLPDSVRLEIYEAIIEYGTSGIVPTLKPTAMLAFNFMRMAIDKDKERYDERSEKAKQSASARWMRSHANDANACERMQEMRTHANDANAQNAMRSDATACYNDNVIVNVIKEKPSKEGKKKAADAAERSESLKAAAKKLTDEVYATDYPDAMKRDFCLYWTEPNLSKTKLRYQMEKAWETSRRLATWANRENPARRGAASEIGKLEFNKNYDETW